MQSCLYIENWFLLIFFAIYGIKKYNLRQTEDQVH